MDDVFENPLEAGICYGIISLVQSNRQDYSDIADLFCNSFFAHCFLRSVPVPLLLRFVSNCPAHWSGNRFHGFLPVVNASLTRVSLLFTSLIIFIQITIELIPT